MKILFLASNLNKIGGIQKYNRNLLKALKENSDDVIVVELKKSNFFLKIIFVFEILLKIFRHKPNIIICSHINFSPICYFAKTFLNCDYTITVYGIEVMDIKSGLRRRALKSAKFIIKLFDWTAENIMRQLPDIKEKIISLPNSVDEKEFFIKEKSGELMEKYDLRGCRVILTMARISREEEQLGNKGYGRVLRALPLIIKEIPKIKYLLVGGGDYLEETKRKVEELGLSGYIVFTGAIRDEERIDYYNLCDVFVLPSKGEGCPAVVLLEALACGKPVITGNRECQAGDLLGGELGIMVNPDNIEEIASAIIKVLKGDSPKLLHNEILRKKALEIYGLAKFKERTKLLLAKLKNKT